MVVIFEYVANSEGMFPNSLVGINLSADGDHSITRAAKDHCQVRGPWYLLSNMPHYPSIKKNRKLNFLSVSVTCIEYISKGVRVHKRQLYCILSAGHITYYSTLQATNEH